MNSLQFATLKVSVSDLNNLIGPTSYNNIVLVPYYVNNAPNTPILPPYIGLRIYLEVSNNGSMLFAGPSFTLPVDESAQLLTVTDNVILSTNFITSDEISGFLNTDDEYLLFTPTSYIFNDDYISYSISTSNTTSPGSGAPVTTNPSPPATITSIGSINSSK